ncbi:MAG: TonB-dependent receptor, partial [Verrucomicrobia bacterium]
MVAVVVGLGMGAAGFASGGPAEPAVALPPMVVTASRAPVALERLPLAVDRLEGAALEAPTALTVDDALRVSPAFSLFRRTGSLTAHPTAQGVSLRGIGPSGASRSLVLLDGLPLNDPFGGWVAWSKVPRLSLGTAEIVRGGGSAVWGSAAIGGTVQLLSRPMSPGTGRVLGEAGSAGLARVEMLGDVSAGQGRLRAGGRWFRTDGWHAIREDQRGGIDRRLDSRHWLAHAAWEGELREGMVLRIGGRAFDERRGNGTPYTGNTSEEAAAHFALAGEVAPDVTVQILGYGQRQRFASRFSSVAADRESERPALDQHDVPADAWGASAVASWRHPDGALTTLGGDWRAVSGETREDYFYSGSGFLRRRHAGGDQWTGGLFAAHQRDIG